MLPFDLPSVAPALLEVDRSLRELGARVAVMAATGLASVIGGEVAVRGRLLPTLPEPAGVALLPIELTALAGRATLAVECSLAARVAERVAGGTGRVAAAGTLGPAERAILELAVLGALDAIAADPAVEGALAPRLALRGGAPARSICVELVITAVGTQGRAYLALPESALRALPRTGDVPQALADVPVPGSLRGGHVSLAPGELDGLRSGDVLLLDEPPPGGAALLLAGGVTARGNLDGDSLEIEDVALPAGAGHDSPPIRIEVELATVDVPLRDVARIAPGAVIALRLDRRGEVTLRVGEMALARGELVDVDGTVGVRISSVERSR
jgi:type III secretion protein Q